MKVLYSSSVLPASVLPSAMSSKPQPFSAPSLPFNLVSSPPVLQADTVSFSFASNSYASNAISEGSALKFSARRRRASNQLREPVYPLPQPLEQEFNRVMVTMPESFWDVPDGLEETTVTQSDVESLLEEYPEQSSSFKVKVILDYWVNQEGMAPEEARKKLEDAGVPYVPNYVPLYIVAAVLPFEAGIPQAGVIKPKADPKIEDTVNFTFNRRDRIRMLYRVLGYYIENNNPKDGQDIIQKTADLLVAIEDIAFEKARLKPPKMKGTDEFVKDNRFMRFRTEARVTSTQKPWIFKVDHGRLIDIPVAKKPNELPADPNYVQLIPSTGEVTVVRGNGAMLIHRTLPHLKRFEPYQKAQQGEKPDFSLGYDVFNYPVNGMDALDREAPVNRRRGRSFVVAIPFSWLPSQRQMDMVTLSHAGKAAQFFKNRYERTDGNLSMRSIPVEDLTPAEGACRSGCPKEALPLD